MQVAERQLKHYRILEKLGEGTLGVVYKARDTKLGEIRAIKVLRPSLVREAALLERFAAEARNLARLSHPNIVTVHWFFEKPPSPFLVMEYVAGASLVDIIREGGALRVEEVLPLIRQILEALAHAHAKGVVHRDLKPANVLVTAAGQVKVVDFGLTKQPDGSDLVESRARTGALQHLSPEHVRRKVPLDHRSDLYATAALLYELLTGRPPHGGYEAAHQVLRAIVEEAIVPPAEVVADVPEALSDVVVRGLARDPAARYASAGAMRAALDAAERQAPVLARRTPALAADAAPRRWGRYAVLAVALVMAVALGAWLLGEDRIAAPAAALAALPVDTVAVTPGVYARLLPSEVAPRRQAVLVLRAWPYGTLRLEGRIVGEDSAEVTVEPGSWPVACTHPVYGEQTADVDVGRGQRKAVVCYFEGDVQVQASDAHGQPLRADVYVDDLLSGRQTPLEERYPLSPGLHTVEPFLDGHVGGMTVVAVRSPADTLLTTPPVASLSFVLRPVENPD